MSFLQEIFWRQGMMLKPHHLQYFDWHHKHLNWKHSIINNTYPWGVMECTIDEGMLKNNIISIEKFEGVFPDGTWIKKGENSVVLNSSFNSASIFAKSNFMIYAGIKRISTDILNAVISSEAKVNNNIETRFYCEPEGKKISNIYEEDLDETVNTAKYIVKIFNDSNIAEVKDYLVMPIASLKKDKRDFVILNSEYIPPAVRIGGNKLFKQVLDSIYIYLKKSLGQLDSYKMKDISGDASPEEVVAYMTPTLIKYRLAIQTLSKYLVLVKHISQVSNTHPLDIFLLLQSLIGELTAFTQKVSILSVDVEDHALSVTYDHLDSGNAFIQCQKLIKLLLDEIVVSEDLNVSFVRESDSTFSVIMPEKLFKLNNRFYIVILTQENPKDWLDEFINFGRIASSARIKELTNRSLPGIGFSYIQETPPGLPARQNAYYFLLDQTGKNWESIYNTRSIAINWDGAPEDTKIDISVVES